LDVAPVVLPTVNEFPRDKKNFGEAMITSDSSNCFSMKVVSSKDDSHIFFSLPTPLQKNQEMSFNTDRADVAPCDRNNCRCGDSNNCMYYNSAGSGQSFYNWSAVQGAGDPNSPVYTCSRRAMDQYNAEGVYADHASDAIGGFNASTSFEGPADVIATPRCGGCDGYRLRRMFDVLPHVDQPVIPRWLVLLAAIAFAYWALSTGRLDNRGLLTAAAVFAVFYLVFFF
jgi:hypothetical protein